jgi:orotidine-5'-phosphate decarboxylase
MITDVSSGPGARLAPSAAGRTTPILALDVASGRDALDLVRRVERAEFVKVGLQLFTAEGPSVVTSLRDLGRRVFLDLKFHDIPNTVARAVESAARLGVELLTLHASGGTEMLKAARSAAGAHAGGPRLMAVTMLTSLSEPELAFAWGRDRVRAQEEVARLARLAADAGMDGVVASVHEIAAIRSAAGGSLAVLTPGIRLSGDAAGDQSRVATPGEAARAGADYIVVGRSVTAVADPAAAFDRLLAELAGTPAAEQGA